MSNTKGKRYFARLYSMNRANRLEVNTLEVHGAGIEAVPIPNDCFYVSMFSIDASLKVSNMGKLDKRNMQNVETWVISDRCARAVSVAEDPREQMGIYSFKNSPNAFNSVDIKNGRYTPRRKDPSVAGEDE